MTEIELLTQISSQLSAMQNTMILTDELSAIVSFLVGALGGMAFVLGVRSMNI